jgi:branched-chain amino acid transport system permease protein
MNRRQISAAACCTLALALALVSLCGTPSDAEARDRIGHQAWANTPPLVTFVPRAGELYVAATAAQEEARSFVQIDVTGLNADAIAGSALVLHEADDGLMSANGSIVACALSDALTSDGQLASAPPSVDCSRHTVAQRSADGSWVVLLREYAGRWAAGGPVGLALIPNTPVGATYRVAFDAAQTALRDVGAASNVVPHRAITRGPTSTLSQPAVASPSLPLMSVPRTDIATAPTEPGSTPQVAPLPATLRRSAGEPGGSNAGSSVLLMLLAGLATAIVARTMLPRQGTVRRMWGGADETSRSSRQPVQGLLLVSLLLAPLLFREVIVFKAGLVMAFLVAAIGLHILVNWAGQLSLAHSVMVGLPAFAVLALSESHGISPIYLLPVAVVVGAATGMVVALPTLRAKDLQVALVTLIAGVAMSRFVFSQSWLVGDSRGRVAATPTLGPLTFSTSRSLYPVMAATLALAITAAWVLMHSKVGRGLAWIRAHPEAASTFGIPVARYRIGAYGLGGAFGGLGGGLMAMWTQRMGADAFPTTLSFTYLLVVVLSGPGFVGGVAVATVVLVGGQLFASNIFGADAAKTVDTLLAYGGPLWLITVLARYHSGLNGLGRKLMAHARQITSSKAALSGRASAFANTSLESVFAITAVVSGFFAIALAWHHISRTDQLWVQNQEILSGGGVGLGLILVGTGLMIRRESVRSQARVVALLEELLSTRDTPSATPLPATSDVSEDTVLASPAVKSPEDLIPSNGSGHRTRTVR